MERKHLLFTVALASAFASCTNEELIVEDINDNVAGVVKENRPYVVNPTLDVTGAASRTNYDGSFTFENGDKLGALLMDESQSEVRGIVVGTDAWNELSWNEKYELVDYVHTDYPFEFQDGKFVANCNMLEGNYFLVYPYACQNGNRQVAIEVSNQKLVGQDAEARKKFIANYQRFIGYAQLNAGSGLSSISANLQPLLAPVRFAIKNEGTSAIPLEVTKIVISNPKLTGTLTVDPTNANYDGKNLGGKVMDWNLNGEKNTYFNYANFLANQSSTKNDSYKKDLYDNDKYGSTLESDYVYNIDEKLGVVSEEYYGDITDTRDERNNNTQAYYWDDAIRAVVKDMDEKNNPEYRTDYIEVLTYENDETPFMTAKAGETIEVAMMLPQFEQGQNDDPLVMTIYTNQGIISDIKLDQVVTGLNRDIKLSGTIKQIDPVNTKVPRVVITLDNPAVVQTPTTATINNGDDLYKLVTLLNNDLASGDKTVNVTYTNDIDITGKIAAEIAKLPENYIIKLSPETVNNGNNLVIKIEDEYKQYANVLEHLDIDSNAIVEVKGLLYLTDESFNIAHDTDPYQEGKLNIEVAKEGKLVVTSLKHESIYGGYDANSNKVQDATEVVINNKGGIVTFEKGESLNSFNAVGFTVQKNEGTLNINEGATVYFAKNSVNTIKGTVNVYGTLSGTTSGNFTNNGIINNYSVIKNVKNLTNGSNLVPGTIIIYNSKDENCSTLLNECTGKIIYKVLNPIKFITNQSVSPEAILEYEHNGGMIEVSDLAEAFVTDLVVKNATLFSDIEESNLKNVVIDNTSVVKVYGGIVGKDFSFKSAGTLTLLDNSTINDVKFYGLNSAVKSLLVNGKNVTFDGNVEFYMNYKNENNDLLDLYLNKSELTIKGATKVNALKSVYGTNSSVDGNTQSTVHVEGSLKVNNTNIDNNIVVDGNPIAKL